MKTISGNLKGIKKTPSISGGKFMTQTHRPDMIFILETMVNKKNINTILL